MGTYFIVFSLLLFVCLFLFSYYFFFFLGGGGGASYDRDCTILGYKSVVPPIEETRI